MYGGVETSREVRVEIEGAKGYTTLLLNGAALSTAAVVDLP